MKIFFLARTLDSAGGGSHINAIAQIRALRSRGHLVEVHAFTKGHNAPPQDIKLTTHESPGGFRAANRYLVDLLLQYEQDIDLFLLYGVDFTWGAGMYRRGGGKAPVSIYVDTYLASMRMGSSPFLYRMKRHVWDRFVGRAYIDWVDLYLAASPYVQKVYIGFGFPEKRFRVVPNFFELQPTIVREYASEAKLLYLGRIIYDKGLDLLFEALCQMKDLSWQLRVVGDGPLLAQCKQRAREFGDRIEFVAWVSQDSIRDHYAWANVFVHPARWPEPFGRTIVEALSTGLPVIVPIKGGSAWVAGQAGVMFTNGDIVSLRNALKKCIENSNYRAQLASHAQKEVQRFSAEQVVPQFEQYLAEIVQT